MVSLTSKLRTLKIWIKENIAAPLSEEHSSALDKYLKTLEQPTGASLSAGSLTHEDVITIFKINTRYVTAAGLGLLGTGSVQGSREFA
jgi:hypothetical protein